MFYAVYSCTTKAIPCLHTAQPHPKSTNSPGPQTTAMHRPQPQLQWLTLQPALMATAAAALD